MFERDAEQMREQSTSRWKLLLGGAALGMGVGIFIGGFTGFALGLAVTAVTSVVSDFIHVNQTAQNALDRMGEMQARTTGPVIAPVIEQPVAGRGPTYFQEQELARRAAPEASQQASR